MSQPMLPGGLRPRSHPHTSAPLARMFRPIMRVWFRSINRGQLGSQPRPLDEPRGHSAGRDPLRVLLVGNGPAVGLGVASHELALPGQIARHLGAQTGRGVDVVAVVDRDLRVGTLPSYLGPRAIRRSDIAVIVLGGPEALTLTSLSEWCEGLERIIAHLREDLPGLPIVFAGPYPLRSVNAFNSLLGAIAERHATRLNRHGARLSAGYEAVRWVEMPPSPAGAARFRSTKSYSEWGELIAGVALPLIPLARKSAPPSVEAEDSDRAAAVGAFRLLTDSPTPDLDRLVDLAQRMFGTAGAAITLIDDERQWVGASSGMEMAADGIDRATSICARTIEQDDVMVVPDTASDDRFARGGVAARVRFYMGYPIHSPDGHRLGALCVYDPEPRTDRRDDPSLLREIGLLAQRALWNLADGKTGVGSAASSDGKD